MIRFGIIGCGAISSVHVANLIQIEHATLVACCDIDNQRGQAFAKKNDCLFYHNYHQLLANPLIDAVIIATPHYLHAKMSIDALDAGKHVLCEKPMAVSIEEARQVIKVSQQCGCIYAVCFQNRFNPSFVKLKNMIDQQLFGELKGIKCEVTWCRNADYYAQAIWKGTWQKEGGGVLINQAIHTLDAIAWLIKPFTKVKGKIMTSLLENKIEVEDAAMATALIGDIPVVIHTSNNYSSSPAPIITLDYTHALIEVSMEELVVNGKIIGSQQIKDDKIKKAQWGNGHTQLTQTFINKIIGRNDPLVTFLPQEDALNALKLVLGIYQSNRENSWIVLENTKILH